VLLGCVNLYDSPVQSANELAYCSAQCHHFFSVITVFIDSNFPLVCVITVALAVYTRSPSAYEALHDLKILQLPHSKTLKKVIKASSEKAGIDEEYLLGQQKTYVDFQKEREWEGHPRPLGLGVMMWDEVKVCTEILNLPLFFAPEQQCKNLVTVDKCIYL